MHKSKKRNQINSSSRNKNNKRKTKRLHLLRRKYKCKKGGATTSSNTPIIGLPMIIDKNNIAYTCTPIPTS
jgi:hypothetical protein